jgi:hypothetical protein
VEAAVDVERVLARVLAERLELVGERLERLALHGIDPFGGEARGERLERDAHLAQAPGLLVAERRDARVAVRGEHDEAPRPRAAAAPRAAA